MYKTALREKMEYQLGQLKKDVNPGLLYNSLETLISLVQQDAALAENFIDRLAALYRYTLEHRHKELVSLEEEVNAMQDLVYLYHQKYQGGIRINSCTAGEETGFLLIPGSLPDIVENIILSTIIQPGRLLEIDIFVENNFVVLHYRSNDRLIFQHPIQETIHRLSQTYRFLQIR